MEETQTAVNANIINGLVLSYSRATKSQERIRILSCVADQYINNELKQNFHFKTSTDKEVACSEYEITQARLHSHLFGPGLQKPPKKVSPRRFYTSLEDIAFLLDFIHSPNCVERSSYRTASCEGKKKSWLSELMGGGGTQPLLWLKHNKKLLYSLYSAESKKKGRKTICKSMFFKGLEGGNFQELSEMAGLCNICTEFGAENFKNLLTITEQIESQSSPQCENDGNNFLEIKERIKNFKGYLLSNFQNNLKMHDTCANHCMNWQLGECQYRHDVSCKMCSQKGKFFHDLKETIEVLNCDESGKNDFISKVEILVDKLHTSIGHLIRGKFQREMFMENINNLKPGETMAVSDYMMKLMFQKLYEPQRDWFGKKGVSVHGVMFLFKDSENRIVTEFHDTFLDDDDTQNWFFTASCLEEATKNFKSLHPDITHMKLWSDNGSHYKNTSLVIWLTSFFRTLVLNW